MSSIQDLRNKINTIKNTQKITKAIKMVATVRLKRAQNELLISRILPNELNKLWQHLNTLPDFQPNHPLISSRQTIQNISLLVITSDHGLCGGFNTAIVQKTRDVLKNMFAGKNINLISLGNKGNNALKYHHIPVKKSYNNFFEDYSLSKVSLLVHELSNDIINGNTDAVFIIYTKLGLSFTTKIEIEQLLPLSIKGIEDNPKNIKKYNWLVEPNIDDVVTRTCELFLISEMHRIFHESLACEQLARTQAMEVATKNAEETLQNLKIVFNKTRQELITKEMLEVIGGTESLE
ncbi:MAG TPA: ATP synthase F1 subunit gamma [Candidatus Hydrogenedens sp.]|nr:ATP synthase F1 subunit gamma [Candidatus Hydrogenedens sp.]